MINFNLFTCHILIDICSYHVITNRLTFSPFFFVVKDNDFAFFYNTVTIILPLFLETISSIWFHASETYNNGSSAAASW